jgi:small subunit ribosomal protein S17
MDRGKMKTVRGTVVSAGMDKTIVVKSERRVKHPRYGKYVRRYTTYYAHDEENQAAEGDEVELASTRPLSKRKRWRLTQVVKAFADTDTRRLEAQIDATGVDDTALGEA